MVSSYSDVQTERTKFILKMNLKKKQTNVEAGLLPEQLKSIYMEERERLLTSNTNGGGRPNHAQRLNKFETKLRQVKE